MLRPFSLAFSAVSCAGMFLSILSCGGSKPLQPIQTFQLMVSISGTGSGTVTSNPAGIRCPTRCTASFPQNTTVTLSATPGSNDVFSAWSGACTGSATCSVAVSGTEAVTASFTSSTGGGAFVYVSSTASNGRNGQIEAFAADSSGQLTAVAGSPFPVSMFGLAGNGKYLFGTDATSLYSYSVAPDGTITKADAIDVRQYNNPLNCSGGPVSLFLDRSGSTLYDLDSLSDCANNTYQSVGVEASTGALTYLGMTTASSPVFERELSFIGNNQFAYGASCYHWIPGVYDFGRSSDGALTLVSDLGAAVQLPSGATYCPWLAAADGSNHLAISVIPVDSSTMQQSGPPQIAVYTVDNTGNATTNSTAANMPQTAGDAINEMTMSPSGTFLAVAETSGLQVFNFNGENPVTQLTGLLTSDPIEEVRWDDQGHIYAISNSSGKIYVFTVAAGGATPAPGSPYSLAAPIDIVIFPRS